MVNARLVTIYIPYIEIYCNTNKSYNKDAIVKGYSLWM